MLKIPLYYFTYSLLLSVLLAVEQHNAIHLSWGPETGTKSLVNYVHSSDSLTRLKKSVLSQTYYTQAGRSFKGTVA
jgi:hypothetical protein